MLRDRNDQRLGGVAPGPQLTDSKARTQETDMTAPVKRTGIRTAVTNGVLTVVVYLVGLTVLIVDTFFALVSFGKSRGSLDI